MKVFRKFSVIFMQNNLFNRHFIQKYRAIQNRLHTINCKLRQKLPRSSKIKNRNNLKKCICLTFLLHIKMKIKTANKQKFQKLHQKFPTKIAYKSVSTLSSITYIMKKKSWYLFIVALDNILYLQYFLTGKPMSLFYSFGKKK